MTMTAIDQAAAAAAVDAHLRFRKSAVKPLSSWMAPPHPLRTLSPSTRPSHLSSRSRVEHADSSHRVSIHEEDAPRSCFARIKMFLF